MRRIHTLALYRFSRLQMVTIKEPSQVQCANTPLLPLHRDAGQSLLLRGKAGNTLDFPLQTSCLLPEQSTHSQTLSTRSSHVHILFQGLWWRTSQPLYREGNMKICYDGASLSRYEGKIASGSMVRQAENKNVITKQE
jgi:hypothetical protein